MVDIEDQYNMGFITDEERYKLVVREWEKTTADVTDHCLYAYGETYDNFLAIQSSRNDRLYVILYPEDAKQPVLETWTKLS